MLVTRRVKKKKKSKQKRRKSRRSSRRSSQMTEDNVRTLIERHLESIQHHRNQANREAPPDNNRFDVAARPRENGNVNNNRSARWEEDQRHQAAILPAIPQNVLDRIRRGEFVSFDLLLPQSAATAPAPNSFSLSFASDASGVLSVSPLDQNSPSSRAGGARNKVTDPRWWFLAWSVFLSVMAVYHAELVPKLINYQNRISRLFTIHPFSNVVDYDAQFRQRLAINPFMSWDRVDEETFSTTLRKGGDSFAESRTSFGSNRQSSEVSCYKCRGIGHYARQCPSYGTNRTPSGMIPQRRPYRPGFNPTSFRKPTNDAKSDEVCVYYNSSYCREGDSCKRVHRCLICASPSHGSHACPAPRPPAGRAD